MIKRFRQQYILTSWNEDCELQLIRIIFVVLAVSDKSCCLKQSICFAVENKGYIHQGHGVHTLVIWGRAALLHEIFPNRRLDRG